MVDQKFIKLNNKTYYNLVFDILNLLFYNKTKKLSFKYQKKFFERFANNLLLNINL